MTTKIRKPRKLSFSGVEQYVASQADLPEGWTFKLLNVGDKIPGGWELVPDPNKAEAKRAWSWVPIGVAVAENAGKEISMVFRFANHFSSIGTEGKRGWKVEFDTFENGELRYHHVEHIGYGGWAEGFKSAAQIRAGLTKRWERKWNGKPGKKGAWMKSGVTVANMVITPIKAGTVSFSGTTRYKVGDTTYTYDRTGVEESFYGDDQQYPTVNALLLHEEERVAKSRATIARSTTIPGLGWSVTPENKERISAIFAKGGSYHFTPSGFGVGKMVSARPMAHSARMPAATAEFFGVSALWVHDTDCD